MPDPKMLADLRAIVERANPGDGFDAGLSVDFIAEHGPALLTLLEGCEAAVLEEREACARECDRLCSHQEFDGNLHAKQALDYAAAAIRSRTPESHPLAKEVTP